MITSFGRDYDPKEQSDAILEQLNESQRVFNIALVWFIIHQIIYSGPCPLVIDCIYPNKYLKLKYKKLKITSIFCRDL